MMDFLTDLFWRDGKFLGIEWHVWKVVGWLGNATFFSRFFVQWYATEKTKQVVVPTAFWWLSLIGSFLPLTLYSGQNQLLQIIHNPAAYSVGLWPALLALWVASVLVSVLLLSSRRPPNRWISALLAAHWAWSLPIGAFVL